MYDFKTLQITYISENFAVSLRLHPKCPEYGRRTGKKYKLIVLALGDYDCHFCKARLAPRFNQHWPIPLGLAAIAALFTISSVDCFVEPKSFGRL